MSALTTLEVLIRKCGGELNQDQFQTVLREIVPLLDAADLHTSQLAINVVTAILQAQPSVAKNLTGDIPILPSILSLALSPVFQGGALQSLRSFLVIFFFLIEFCLVINLQ